MVHLYCAFNLLGVLRGFNVVSGIGLNKEFNFDNSAV